MSKRVIITVTSTLLLAAVATGIVVAKTNSDADSPEPSPQPAIMQRAVPQSAKPVSNGTSSDQAAPTADKADKAEQSTPPSPKQTAVDAPAPAAPPAPAPQPTIEKPQIMTRVTPPRANAAAHSAPQPHKRPAPAPRPGTPQKSKYDVGPVDMGEMFELINAERAKRGVGQLTRLGNLDKSSREQADYNARINKLSHEGGLERIGRHEPGCGGVGEILQMTMASDTTRSAVIRWINSTGHNKIMFSGNYKKAGVDYVKKDDRHSYVAMHFCE